jgi:hypothetical protein
MKLGIATAGLATIRTRPVKATGEDEGGCAGHSIKQLWRRDFVGANSKGVAR